MNLLTLRQLIVRALAGAPPATLPLGEILNVERVNPGKDTGNWGLLITVADPYRKTDAPRTYRLNITEEPS